MPINVHGFIRDYNGKIAITDQQLAALTAANVGARKRWAAIDFIFAQCYGGTFVNRLSRLSATPLTAVAAADWDQVAWNVVGAKDSPLLENFTHAWLESAASKPAAGMREIADRARERDWTGPVSKIEDLNLKFPEHPNYASSDTAPGGASDLRRLQQGGSERLFTAIGVIGIVDKVAERHRINAGRVTRLARARSAPEQVAGLLGNGTSGYPAGSQPVPPDTVATPALRAGAANTTLGLTSVMTGEAFGKAAESGDRLLLYVTGHGGRAVYERFRDNTVDTTPHDGVPDGVQIYVRLPRPTQRESGLPIGSFNANIFGDSDDTNPDVLQFHLRKAIGFDALDPTAPKLLIGGVDHTARLIPVAGDAVLQLPTVAEYANPPVAQVYQLELPHDSWFDFDAPEIELTFSGIGQLALEPNLLSALYVWAGDNEFLAVNVPEPSIGVLSLVGLIMLAIRRRTRVDDR